MEDFKLAKSKELRKDVDKPDQCTARVKSLFMHLYMNASKRVMIAASASKRDDY